MTSILIGYAIGTAQILLLDWYRARRAHDRHLRLVRAELRRARGQSETFEWTEDGPSDTTELIPKPPQVSDVFTDTLARTDFYLTDEHEGDNCQESLFGLLDGLELLAHYRSEILRRLDEAILCRSSF